METDAKPPGPHDGRQLLRALPWLAATWVLIVASLAWSYSVDDAYVIARYATRLAAGRGWTMNDGPPTDGITGPLAIVPGFVASALGADAHFALKGASVLCAALASGLVVHEACRGSLGARSAWATLALVAASGTLSIWSVAGLETGLATLAATSAAVAWRKSAVLGASIAVLAWLRPELAVFAAVLLVSSVLRYGKMGARAFALAAVGAGSVLAFRLAMFGSPWPLSWAAKPAELARGASYVLRASLVVFGAGVGLGALARRPDRPLAVALLAHAMAVLVAGGDWMPGFRLFAPVVPVYAYVAGRAFAQRSVAGSRVRALASVLMALGVLVPAADLAVQVPRAREAGAIRERVGPPLALLLARLAGEGAVALVDVGFLPYRGELERVIDLGGITDPSIGRLAGAHLAKPVEPALLEARDTRVVVLRSFVPPRVDDEGRITHLVAEPVERRLASSSWLRTQFRVARVVEWSPAYFYVVLVRRGSAASQ